MTRADLDAMLAGSAPVLLHFTAAWCGPCKTMEPIIDAVATEYAGRLAVAKIDVQQLPELADRYMVRSVPTLMVVRGMAVLAQRTGACSRREAVKMVERGLARYGTKKSEI